MLDRSPPSDGGPRVARHKMLETRQGGGEGRKRGGEVHDLDVGVSGIYLLSPTHPSQRVWSAKEKLDRLSLSLFRSWLRGPSCRMPGSHSRTENPLIGTAFRAPSALDLQGDQPIAHFIQPTCVGCGLGLDGLLLNERTGAP
jgi:hypothetical protein